MLYISNMKTSIGEWQRDYLWGCTFITIPALAKVGHAQAFSRFQEVADLLTSKGVWPNRKQEEIAIKWAGEIVYYAGPDGSDHGGSFTFRDDELGIARECFTALKDLTGDEYHQVSQMKALSTFDMAVYRVNNAKNAITAYRLLSDCQVFGVSESEPDKAGSDINTFTVDLKWDRNLPDNTMIGKAL